MQTASPERCYNKDVGLIYKKAPHVSVGGCVCVRAHVCVCVNLSNLAIVGLKDE